MTVVLHRHVSMLARLSRTEPDTVAMVLDRHRSRVTVITGTEATLPVWDRRLLFVPGWDALHEPGQFAQGDPWVGWNDGVWERRTGFVRCVGRTTYNGRRVHFAAQKLKHRQQGARVFFLAGHMPAHLEGDMRRARRTTRTVAYVGALRGLRRLIRDIRAEHPGASVVVAADWNLNLHRPWVRALLRSALRGTDLQLVPIRSGTPGSHGPRLIDWVFTDLDSAGEVLDRTAASDHDPVQFVHRLP